MKKNTKIIILASIAIIMAIFCIFSILITQNPFIFATDSGFDGGFGGGSSGGSSGGGYGGSGSSSDSGSIIDLIILFFENPLLFLTILGIVFVIIVITSLIGEFRERKNKKKQDELFRIVTKKLMQNDEILSKYGCNRKEVVYEAFRIYKDVQIAWMNNDLDSVRDVLSDEIFNMYKTQLLTLTAKNQKNMMEDFLFLNGGIKSLKDENDELTLEIKLSVSCKDYLINTNTNEVVKGNKNSVFYTYILTFVVNKNVNVDKCPNCSAPITKDGKSIKCDYCGSIINRKSNKMVMTKKSILNSN